MKNKFRKILIACMVITPAFAFMSCEKNFDSQDDDLIAGKWRYLKTINLEKFKETDKMSYIEFAPYNYVFDKRTYKEVSFEYDPTQSIPYMRTTRTGHYTLNGDSLTVKDYKLHYKYYKVISIKGDMMCRETEEGEIDTLIRYDGSEEIGKSIRDVYNK